MKKILFTFVGKQDPFSNRTNEEGPIAVLARKLKPDIIYSFPSAEGLKTKSSTESNANDTKTWIEDEVSNSIKFYIRTINIVDPTDYIKLINNMKIQINEIINNEIGDKINDVELHANCSSGTPAMQSLWIIFSSTGYIPNLHLWQVANPEYCYADNRVKEINDAFIVEENIISRIKQYAQDNKFQTIVNELDKISKITIYNERKNKANILKKIFESYSKWDLIKYKEANDELRSVRKLVHGKIDIPFVEDIINDQIKTLDNLSQGTENENNYNLIDLYYNTLRRYADGDYTDVLARFWRIYEGILFKILKSKKIDARNLSNGNGPKIKKELNIIHRNYLELKESDDVLTKYEKDSNFIEFKSKKIEDFYIGKTMNSLREKRNQSIIAHGMKPIDENDAYRAVKIMKEMVIEFLNDNDFSLINNYTLSNSNSLKLIEILN